MSRVPWPKFLHRQPQAHLVVGSVIQEDGPVGGSELQGALTILRRLVINQKPAGDYATMVARDTGWPELYVAFENEKDALKFAASVQAQPIGSYPGWASQRAFEIDGLKLKALAASLPPPRIQPKQPPSYEARLLGRARRGPRAPIKRYDEY
jgi:hypothetical protein